MRRSSARLLVSTQWGERRRSCLAHAVLETGDAAEMSGEGAWQIFEGFGTGDLTDVSGKGKGSGSVCERSQDKGTIRCG